MSPVMIGNKSLFDALGGRPTLERVHKIFYDKIYDDPWISKFFTGIRREHIESQQTDFMSQAMGGPKVYSGRFPIPAHSHMNITEELFNLRNKYLSEALKESKIPEELAEKWLHIDASFKTGIMKPSLGDCKKRYFTDEILDFPNPNIKEIKKTG